MSHHGNPYLLYIMVYKFEGEFFWYVIIFFSILIVFISFFPLIALPNVFRTVLEKKEKTSALSDLRENVCVHYFTI